MKEKKKNIINEIKKIIKNKRFVYVSSIILLAFFSITLNFAFSAFTNKQENVAANIKVKNMSYSIAINGTAGTKLTVSENKTTTANLVINSLNNVDSKYELTYKICSTSACNSYIDKPASLTIEYSSRTIDSISGIITSSGVKQIRIAVTNTSATTYYIELGINAGYTHNTLALQNLITTEYNEEDITIAAIINGEISTTFPTTNEYMAIVTCTTNGGASNASGSAVWDGNKWVVNITGTDSGRTKCNVDFNEQNLKNVILTQGGGKLAIDNKATPNFDTVAPAINEYKEVTLTYASNLTSNNNRTIGSGYTFNKNIGRYTLTNYVTSQSYGTGYIGYYTCASSSYSNCSTMYKINTVSGTSITNTTRYQSEVNTYNYSDTGLYAAEDDYGTSYYYRGDKNLLNNNLIWGGLQWKIIRINGDGSIRLIYNGTEAQFNQNGIMNNTGTNTYINAAEWNLDFNDDAKYVGYMYGGLNGVASTIRNGTTSTAATYNQTSANIKIQLDNWYKTNIVDKGLSSNVIDNIFCNDRQLTSEVGGASSGPGYGNTGETTYYTRQAISVIPSVPTLKCALKNDRFTVSDTIKGNSSLTYPVGLITVSEAAMAGLKNNASNLSNYLYIQYGYWTFTPSMMYSDSESGSASVYIIGYDGVMTSYDVKESNSVRPTVSIRGTIRVTGEGTSTNPFKAI